jgi:hypothetical protein
MASFAQLLSGNWRVQVRNHTEKLITNSLTNAFLAIGLFAHPQSRRTIVRLTSQHKRANRGYENAWNRLLSCVSLQTSDLCFNLLWKRRVCAPIVADLIQLYCFIDDWKLFLSHALRDRRCGVIVGSSGSSRRSFCGCQSLFPKRLLGSGRQIDISLVDRSSRLAIVPIAHGAANRAAMSASVLSGETFASMIFAKSGIVPDAGQEAAARGCEGDVLVSERWGVTWRARAIKPSLEIVDTLAEVAQSGHRRREAAE